MRKIIGIVACNVAMNNRPVHVHKQWRLFWIVYISWKLYSKTAKTEIKLDCEKYSKMPRINRKELPIQNLFVLTGSFATGNIGEALKW